MDTTGTCASTVETITAQRLDDDTAHRHAVQHAVRLLGLDSAPSVVWDEEFHLQGHLDVSGRHLVLIAPRTDDRAPRLFTEDEWDGLRHGVRAA